MKKYLKLENVNKETTTTDFVRINKNKLVEVSHKIDGANISMYYDKNKDAIALCSRNNIKGYIQAPFDANTLSWNHINTQIEKKEFIKTLSRLKEVSLTDDKVYVIFGEIYGSPVLNRVQYLKEVGTVNIKFFEVYIADDIEALGDSKENTTNYMTPKDAIYFFTDTIEMPLHHLIHTESLYLITTLQQALTEIDVENIDAGYGKNIEGIVIKGWDEHFTDKWGNRRVMKFKSEKFSDTKSSKKVAIPIELTQNQIAVVEIINGMINENRLLDFISKNPDHNEMKFFGMIMQGIITDVTDDYNEANGTSETSKTLKFAFNACQSNLRVLIKSFLVER